jgi:acyl-CoA reductase-like NAD-dependent aldehyde dehydrogenase
MRTFTHLIDGKASAGEQGFDVIDPATGQPFAQCPDATPAHIDAAAAAAARAFQGAWSRDETLRRRTLTAMGDALEAEADEIGKLLCREQGKPLASAVGEVRGAAQSFRRCALDPLPKPEVLRDDERSRVTLLRRPIGVTACIAPWNFPIGTLVVKMAPALLLGNTVVAKPSPFTPLSTLALGAAIAGVVPPGVVNVLGGSDQAGAQLTLHPSVRKISFTGSVATGKKVMRAAADDLKRVTLELGGNDPAIVLPDIDAKAMASRIFWGAFANSGQVCVAIKRLYVHEDVYPAVLDALSELAQRVKVGPGLEAGTQLGPINNRMQFERVQELVEDARKHGGKVVTGGAPLDRPGYFYPPTLVTEIGEGVRLVDEEQFGTALPVVAYRDLDDAIEQANRTHFGLGASVWTSNVERGEELAARIESGTTWVNQHMALGRDFPFGGMKWSGIGRQNGPWGAEEFCELQVVNVARS